MKDAEFTQFAGLILNEIRDGTPKDTGNLRYNATVKEPVGHGRFRIRVKEEIAPYFKYVNGQRTIRGRPNKNQGYFDRAVRTAVQNIAKKYGGRVEGV